MINIYGDKYEMIEADDLRGLHEKIESKSGDGYELVAMMNMGSSIMGTKLVAAMTKSEITTNQKETT